MPGLELRHIYKRFDPESALTDINLTLDGQRILALLGPSGCGKTTLLRIIAGLEQPDTGTILFDDQDMGPEPPHKRDFGLMFQDYALFPHLNVGENIAYGLRVRGINKEDRKKRVEELLGLVGLAGFSDRSVHLLSGGEKQRVALARSLAPNPRLLMLDEPLAALDRALRDHLGPEIKKILKQVGIPAILVTHDQREAFAMADLVAVFDQGRIAQCAPPEVLYACPATAQVACFIGLENIVAPGPLHTALQAWVTTEKKLLIRPDAIRSEGPGPCFAAIIKENLFQGQRYQTRVRILDQELLFYVSAPLPLDTEVDIVLDTEKIQALEE